MYLLQDGRKISKKKTAVKRDDTNPVFNEAMIFSVPAIVLQVCPGLGGTSQPEGGHVSHCSLRSPNPRRSADSPGVKGSGVLLGAVGWVWGCVGVCRVWGVSLGVEWDVYVGGYS